MEEKKTSQQLEREIGFIKNKIVVVERIKCIYDVKRKMLEEAWLFLPRGISRQLKRGITRR